MRIPSSRSVLGFDSVTFSVTVLAFWSALSGFAFAVSPFHIRRRRVDSMRFRSMAFQWYVTQLENDFLPASPYPHNGAAVTAAPAAFERLNRAKKTQS